MTIEVQCPASAKPLPSDLARREPIARTAALAATSVVGIPTAWAAPARLSAQVNCA